MKKMLIAALGLSMAGAAMAQNASCNAAAAEKKLAGAAKTSFMKKCEKDAGGACETQAAEKKLAGAAKISYIKKCQKDAAGG